MSTARHTIARRVRTGLAAAAITGAGMAGLLGVTSAANASTVGQVRTNGWVVVTSCTGLSGKITYSPGMLTSKTRSVKAVMTGTTSGCSNIDVGAFSGTGTFTAILSGKASVDAENFTGTFTINWPASSGFNPSTGTISVTEANGLETMSGTVTGGAWTSAELSGQYVTTGNTGKGTAKKPVKAQTYTNSQSLNLSENFG